MRDRLFFPLLGLIAAGMVALALVWPQGAGAPSRRPFGHPLATTTLSAPAVSGPAAMAPATTRP